MVALTLTIIFALIVVTFIALTIKIIPQQKLESLKDLVSFSGLCSGIKFINSDCGSRSRISRLAYSTNECTTAEGNYER